MTQDSSDWTKLEPEVNSTDADEAPTYSLQSAAGHFECRVSGLRWVCKGKTSFQYQFRSWEGHMERMESRQYMPAGPLMDVTVTAGKLNEVHLPHWICIDAIPDILDMFAVVHIDDCGDVVEKVSEVTPSHVKLTEPNFSIIAALIRFIFPPKISCYMLMYYQLNTSFLKLHVYLIRQDPALEQRFDDRESCEGFKRIRKHHPDKYLQTERLFSLRADNASAKIQPKALTLRYNNQNLYELYIKNPGSELILTLLHTEPLVGEPDDPLWICEIRKEDDHPESGYVKEKHSVDEDLSAQMQKTLTVHSDREKLLGMLEDLKKDELEKFKWFLRDRDVLVELQPIPESRLEKTSTCNLVDLMLQTYTEKSVEVTKKVLKKITSSLQKENHFVDKHRVELIQRVSNIEPILDELLKEKVIQQESYDRIRALQTSQEKMRELYSGPLKAGSASKDVFYQILQTHERLLVNDLC
ncbi:NACHT, LRR and PYD domains-containing protein 1b allele 5-like isoform X1 [Oreochromis aureus]|uniref:NACHT, LRR and PYD domains-containing protein 1b allele 5-like isoform X1 n=1 Tax=Oreochromis aureus TaxID=47969 RepID=UPI001954C27D|nr:NACHT, LRR and PYD domains-containing protein 1b allele 5-like isoform X1 [Oreochromis aureus]